MSRSGAQSTSAAPSSSSSSASAPPAVCIDDVLGAMVNSLLEVKYVPPALDTITLAAKKAAKSSSLSTIRVVKPPKEVFYRESIRFAPKPPKPVLRQRCTCGYLCKSALAVFKCLSCALYEPTGICYYCKLCFDARHPWYRVNHIFTQIEQDEAMEINMKIMREEIDMRRFRDDGETLLRKVQRELGRVGGAGDDAEVDDKLRTIGRKVTSAEDTLRRLRRAVRGELIEAGVDGSQLVPTDEDKVAFIQRVFRGHKIRRAVSRLMAERLLLVWDKETGREFYHDPVSQLSSWTRPRLLQHRDAAQLRSVDMDSDGSISARSETSHSNALSVMNIWTCKQRVEGKRRRLDTIQEENEASLVLQGLFHCIKARKKFLKLIHQTYVRVWDDDYKQYYYANVVTGDSSWTKPRLLLQNEAPLFVDEHQNKHNPRFNRDHTFDASDA